MSILSSPSKIAWVHHLNRGQWRGTTVGERWEGCTSGGGSSDLWVPVDTKGPTGWKAASWGLVLEVHLYENEKASIVRIKKKRSALLGLDWWCPQLSRSLNTHLLMPKCIQKETTEVLGSSLLLLLFFRSKLLALLGLLILEFSGPQGARNPSRG